MSRGSLEVLRLYEATPDELAARSQAWADTETSQDAGTLTVAVPSANAAVLGAFQRAAESALDLPVAWRGSGGGVAAVGPGTVWMHLALGGPGALVADARADTLINRYVRPLLRALTRVSSVPVSYFGRDWISARHRPVALVAFAHEASSGKSLFEAIIAVRTPFAPTGRATFLGKDPATLEEISGRALEPKAVAEAIADAYSALAAQTHELDAASSPSSTRAPRRSEPAWSATREEAIGTIAAGRDALGILRVGGELMASRDAIIRLEELASALPPDASTDDVGRAVDDALTTRGAVTFGVRSLASIRDVILEALRAPAQNIA